MGQLDASIVQLALPTLEDHFTARLSEVSWVALAYPLGVISTLPIFARLAEMTGRKLMYLFEFALFAFASASSGLASNLPQLIGLRVLQGIAGAMMAGNSVAILVKVAAPTRQERGLGIYAAAQAIGLSLGPVVGGLLLATLGWRWIFWVNVPFALAGAIIGWFVIPKTTDLSSDHRFDWQGGLLLMPALTALLMLISESHAWGLSSPAIIACAIAAAALLWAFTQQERRMPAPLVDLNLFRIGAFAGGILAIIFSYAMLYGMLFLMSFALLRGYHDSPLAAGLRLAIIPVALGIVAPFSGALHQRLGARTVLFSGMAICGAAAILLSVTLTGTAASLTGVMIALAAFGGGMGIFIAPNNSATVDAAPGNRRGEAAALLGLTRIFGTSVGVAFPSAVLSWRLAVRTGIEVNSTLVVSTQTLLGGVSDGLLLLIAFAVIAGVISLLKGPPPPPVESI